MSDQNPDLNSNPGPAATGVVAPAASAPFVVPMPPEVMGVPLPQDRPPGVAGAQPAATSSVPTAAQLPKDTRPEIEANGWTFAAGKVPQRVERKLPLHWQREKGTLWAHACLAAAAVGWDPRQDGGEVTERQYEDALRVAQALLEKCRQEAPGKAHGDSLASRRVVIIAHPNAMTAVVALKPSIAELPALMQAMYDQNSSAAQQQSAQAHALWSRVLWPEAAGQQVIMDEYPFDYLLHWPNAYIASLVVSGSDVRKKL